MVRWRSLRELVEERERKRERWFSTRVRNLYQRVVVAPLSPQNRGHGKLSLLVSWGLVADSTANHLHLVSFEERKCLSSAPGTA